MIGFIRRYWKYLTCALVILVTLILSVFYYQKNNRVSTSNVKKLSLVKEEKEEISTVFVDVKGAVNAPGVYEIDDEKRIIDAINLAGGLSDNADTVNLNLSKRLNDEMYIIVYTKEEIYNYKKNNENDSKIKCASYECVCPDTNNDACIKNTVDNKDNTNDKKGNKVSINTAGIDELMTLDGIGEAKANAIISYRQENGPFKSTQDIKNVSGIGDTVYEKIKENIIL